MNATKNKHNRYHYEVCFVRNLECLHDDELRLVLRDKVMPLGPQSEEEGVVCDDALLRIAHSDTAFTAMFEVCCGDFDGESIEPDAEAYAETFSLEIDNGEREIELGSDAHIYFKGVERKEIRYFSFQSGHKRWYVIVVPLTAMGLKSNARGVQMVVTMPHRAIEDAVVWPCEIDFV